MRHRETEKMVREKVLEETNYRCAYCGKGRGLLGEGVEVHHIGGRNNITRFDPRGQIALIDEHHRLSNEFSAQNTPKKFLSWLRKNYPRKFSFYIRNRNKIVQDRDVDIKRIQKELRAA